MKTNTFYFLLFTCLLFQACNSEYAGTKNVIEDESEQDKESAFNPTFAFNDSTLIFLVLPDFTVDSLVRVQRLDTLYNGNQVQMNYFFDQGQLLEANGQIVGPQLDLKASELLIEHLNRFNATHSQSDGFHTWIFDLKERPIIQLNALIKTDTVDLEIFLRQHI